MNMKLEGIEQEKKSGVTEEQKAFVERMNEIGTALESAPDLESVAKILEENADFDGVEEYLQPIYIFQQHPSLENAKMVPDPSGFGILEVLKKFVTEVDPEQDSEGFVPIKKKNDKQGKGSAAKSKKSKIVEPNEEVVVANSDAETEQTVDTEVELTAEKEPEIVKNSRPNPNLTYKDFLKEKEVKKEKRNPQTNIREALNRERNSPEMDKELAGWADGALKGDNLEKVTPTRAEILAKPFIYQDRPQSDVLGKLGKAFVMENKNKESGNPGLVRGLIEKFEKRLKYAKEFDGIENVDLNKIPPEDHEAFLIEENEDEKKYLNKLMHSKGIPSVEKALNTEKIKPIKKEKPKLKYTETSEIRPQESLLRRWMKRWFGKDDLEVKPKTYGKIKRSGGKQDGREEVEEETN
jgi:hypothetical protein